MTEITKTRKKKYTYFIGIDVSKHELDYAVVDENGLLFHKEDKNDTSSIFVFLKRLDALPGFLLADAVFCMENTGIYCNHLLFCLDKLNANVILGHAFHIKRSQGLVRGKDDKEDAIRIANYARKNVDEVKLWTARRPVILELSSLFALHNRLKEISKILGNPLKEQTSFLPKKLSLKNTRACRRTANAMKADLARIEEGIELLIQSDARLKNLKKLITSVPGIGAITAVQIIISTNEFKSIDSGKKFACYAGVAPFLHESGLGRPKSRTSYFASRKVNSLLHICALSAIKSDRETKAYFERKTKLEGKPGLVAVNAIKNKMILKVFACVKQNRVFIKDYVRAEDLAAGELGGI